MKLLFDQISASNSAHCSLICSPTVDRLGSLVSINPKIASFGSMPKTTALSAMQRHANSIAEFDQDNTAACLEIL